jgi:hypothetical protein
MDKSVHRNTQKDNKSKTIQGNHPTNTSKSKKELTNSQSSKHLKKNSKSKLKQPT